MKLFDKSREGRRRVVKVLGIKILSYESRDARRIRADRGNVLRGIPAACEVRVYGRGNRVLFHEPVDELFSGSIFIGAPDCPANGCVVEIGAGTTSNGCEIRLMEDGSRCLIGADCMFSDDVSIWGSDTHAILSGGRLNFGEIVSIGDHVWIGQGATILKNTVIPGGCVIGAKAVVSGGRELSPRSVLAGNPARVVRTDITWCRERPNQVREQRGGS